MQNSHHVWPLNPCAGDIGPAASPLRMCRASSSLEYRICSFTNTFRFSTHTPQRYFSCTRARWSRSFRTVLNVASHTLQATALVHEAWLRLAKGNVASARERGHFVALAASAMRSVLVDHARARGALKRGGGSRGVPLDEALEVFASRVPDLLELNEELDRLAELDPRAAKTVELRFFGGLSIAETAGVLEVSAATVERDWSTARDFLAARLAPGPTDAEG